MTDRNENKLPRLVTVSLHTMKVSRKFGMWPVIIISVVMVLVMLNYATIALRFFTLEMKTETYKANTVRVDNVRRLTLLTQKELAQEDNATIRDIAEKSLGMRNVMPADHTFTLSTTFMNRDRYKITADITAPYQSILTDAASRVEYSPVRDTLLSFVEAGKAFAAASDIISERRTKQETDNADATANGTTSDEPR